MEDGVRLERVDVVTYDIFAAVLHLTILPETDVFTAIAVRAVVQINGRRDRQYKPLFGPALFSACATVLIADKAALVLTCFVVCSSIDTPLRQAFSAV